MFAGKDEGFKESEMRSVDDVRQVDFREFKLRRKLSAQLPNAVEEVEKDRRFHFRLPHSHDTQTLQETMACWAKDDGGGGGGEIDRWREKMELRKDEDD